MAEGFAVRGAGFRTGCGGGHNTKVSGMRGERRCSFQF